MDDGEPTHFGAILLGTGLVESIVAAALSKAGYSILHLDTASVYGGSHTGSWASLTLSELLEWHRQRPAYEAAELEWLVSEEDQQKAIEKSSRFSISLRPTVLKALPSPGSMLDVLLRSKVANYVQFGVLGGMALIHPAAEGAAKVERVPSTKADVFLDKTLSLVEKRRVMKVLQFAAGADDVATNATVAASTSFQDALLRGFNLPAKVADPLAFALALATSSQDEAAPAFDRLRTILHASNNRFGAAPSPFLVGQYGGAGDLIGGFSRLCAVWGGGQILGREVSPLKLAAPVQRRPKISEKGPETSTEPATALGLDVQLDSAPQPPSAFTADRIIVSPYLLSALLPATEGADGEAAQGPTWARTILVLSAPIPFPSVAKPASTDDGNGEEAPPAAPQASDSNLMTFKPSSDGRCGTVTAFQAASGTFTCPDGYYLVYIDIPLLEPPQDGQSARTISQFYVNALLSLLPPDEASPILLSCSRFTFPPPPTPAALPDGVIVTPPLPSEAKSDSIAEILDQAATLAEQVFWSFVGENTQAGAEGKEEGIEFFAKNVDHTQEDED